jgi:hypothetical protein
MKDVLYMSRDARQDRVKIAEEHIKALEPSLARLTLRVPASARAPGLSVAVDGAARSEAAWGSAIPIDPGEHHVVASAPGRAPWETTVAVARAEQRVIDMPTLDPASPAEAARTPAHVEATTSTHEEPRGRTGPPVAAYAIGGVGVVALGLGTYFGVHAATQKSAADGQCGATTCRTQDGVNLNDDARRSAAVADVALAGGIVATGVGLAWLLSSRGPVPANAGRRTSVAPIVATDRAGVVVTGTF